MNETPLPEPIPITISEDDSKYFYDTNDTVVLGHPENYNFTIDYLGEISIGSKQSNNQIFFNGSIAYEYEELNSGDSIINLSSTQYFIEVTNSNTTELILPLITSAPGRVYILSKGFSGGSITISADSLDNIEGNPSITLTLTNQKLKLINNSSNNWYII